MNCDSPSSEVIDPQHAADDISSHIIKHQDLPDRIAILVQYRGGNEALRGRIVVGVFRGLRFMVQVENLVNGG